MLKWVRRSGGPENQGPPPQSVMKNGDEVGQGPANTRQDGSQVINSSLEDPFFSVDLDGFLEAR